jgi:hypothetical protein
VWQTLKDLFHVFGPASMIVASLAAGILAYVIVILKTNEQDGAIYSAVITLFACWLGAVIFWALGAACGSLAGVIGLLNLDPQEQIEIRAVMDVSILWGREIGKYLGVLFTVVIASYVAIKDWRTRRALALDIPRAATHPA